MHDDIHEENLTGIDGRKIRIEHAHSHIFMRCESLRLWRTYHHVFPSLPCNQTIIEKNRKRIKTKTYESKSLIHPSCHFGILILLFSELGNANGVDASSDDSNKQSLESKFNRSA